MRLVTLIMILAALILIFGCSTVEPVSRTDYQPPEVSSQHRVVTTYELGVPKVAAVGERMLAVQDFYEVVTQQRPNEQRLAPTESFSMELPPFTSVEVRAGDSIWVRGTTERDGRTYRLVRLPGTAASQLLFLLDDDGRFHGAAMNAQRMPMGRTYRPQPETVRLQVASGATSVDRSKGYTNFELIYNGRTRDAFQVLYREYTQNDLVRPAFTQTLVYDVDSTSIRFRNLQMQIEEASSEQLRFTVVADGNGRL